MMPFLTYNITHLILFIYLSNIGTFYLFKFLCFISQIYLEMLNLRHIFLLNF